MTPSWATAINPPVTVPVNMASNTQNTGVRRASPSVKSRRDCATWLEKTFWAPGDGALSSQASSTITTPWIIPNTKNALLYPDEAIMLAIGMIVRRVPDP